jgi:anti-anti-sigma factor
MENTSGIAIIRIDPPHGDVHASGEFDIATTPTLTGQLRDIVDAGCVDLRFDLEHVTFCDASTVGVLVTARRRVLADGGSFEITAASTCVRRIFSLVGLTSMLADEEPTEAVVLA